jgi:hypothetical protein
VKHMADMAIRLAKEPRRPVDLRRGEFLIGRRFQGDDVPAAAATTRTRGPESRAAPGTTSEAVEEGVAALTGDGAARAPQVPAAAPDVAAGVPEEADA